MKTTFVVGNARYQKSSILIDEDLKWSPSYTTYNACHDISGQSNWRLDGAHCIYTGWLKKTLLKEALNLSLRSGFFYSPSMFYSN